MPTLAEMLALVAGRVPLVIELKGIAGHDAGLVAKVAAQLRRLYGQGALMSFDHWIDPRLSREMRRVFRPG